MTDTLLKYIAAGVLMGSLFYLVLTHQLDPSLYVTVVLAALASLGIHAGAVSLASKIAPQTPQQTPTFTSPAPQA